jgi:hypothetical protein
MKDNSPSRPGKLGFSVKQDRIASAIFRQFNGGKKWNLCDCRPMLEHAIEGGRVTMLTPRTSELGFWAISRDERTIPPLRDKVSHLSSQALGRGVKMRAKALLSRGNTWYFAASVRNNTC